MTAATRGHESAVPRPRLVDAVEAHRGVVVVEAPHGYGKSVLLRQLADAADGPVFSVDWQARVVRRPRYDGSGDAIVLIDDVGSVEQARAACALVDEGVVERAVVASRRLATDIRRVLSSRHLLEIDADQLRFTPGEAAQLARVLVSPDLGPPVAQVVEPTAAGWPIAVAAFLRSAGSNDDPLRAAAALTSRSPVAAALVDAAIGDLDDPTLDAICQLAHLGVFTQASADALAEVGAVARAVSAGLPVVRGVDGWLRLPPVVQLALRERRPFDSDTARLVAPSLIASAGVVPGLRVLLRADAGEDAARLLSSLPGSQIDAIDTHDLLGMLRTLELHADAYPRLHLAFGRVYGNLGWISEQGDAVRAALGAATELGDETVAAEAEAELLFLRSLTGHNEGVAEAVAALRDRIAEPSPALRVRLREVEALAVVQSPDPVDVERSCALLREVASEWETLGENGMASATLRLLAATSLGHLGDHRGAQAALRRARSLVIDRPFDRAVTAVLMCRSSALAGDLAAFATAAQEAEALARATGLPWIEAYLGWAHMHVAALHGDLQEVARSHSAVEEALGELLATPTGVVFRSEAAACFAMAGDDAAATAQLNAIDPESTEIEVALAAVTVHARADRHREALAARAAVFANELVPTSRRWRAELEVALMLGRLGLPADHHRRPAEAGASRMRLGPLVELLDDGTLPAVIPEAFPPAVSIQVLGRFGVRRSGEEVSLPSGHVSDLLCMLAVSRRRLTVETVIDRLWPEASLERGRRRLKNVVSRARQHLGLGAVERDATSLALGSGVVTDLDLFEAAAQRALTAWRASDPAAIELVVAALDLCGGEVVPGESDGEWVVEARLATRSRAAALLDVVFESAAPEVPGPWLLDTVLRIDPADDARLLAVARRCHQSGHDGSAKVAVEKAMVIARELDLELDRELIDLRNVVGAGSTAIGLGR